VQVKNWDAQNSLLLENINNKFSSENYAADFIEIFKYPQSELTEKSWNLTSNAISDIKEKMVSNAWHTSVILNKPKRQD